MADAKRGDRATPTKSLIISMDAENNRERLAELDHSAEVREKYVLKRVVR